MVRRCDLIVLSADHSLPPEIILPCMIWNADPKKTVSRRRRGLETVNRRQKRRGHAFSTPPPSHLDSHKSTTHQK